MDKCYKKSNSQKKCKYSVDYEKTHNSCGYQKQTETAVIFYSSLSWKLKFRTSLQCQPRYSFSVQGVTRILRIYPEEVS